MRGNVETDDARMYLRTHTRDAHMVLDSHPCMAALVSHDAPAGDIWRALVGMLTAHQRLAQACDRAQLYRTVPRELFDGSAGSRLQFDIMRYSRPLPAIDRCASNIPFDTLEAQLGVAYVIAGSSLGSKRISENLRRHPDPWVASLTYFDSMAAVAPLFASLIETLRSNLLDRDQMDRATESANLTFACFAQAMDDVWHLSKMTEVQ
jgi:heme oxygenase